MASPGSISGEAAEKQGLRRPTIRVATLLWAGEASRVASSAPMWRLGVQCEGSVRDPIRIAAPALVNLAARPGCLGMEAGAPERLTVDASVLRWHREEEQRESIPWLRVTSAKAAGFSAMRGAGRLCFQGRTEADRTDRWTGMKRGGAANPPGGPLPGPSVRLRPSLTSPPGSPKVPGGFRCAGSRLCWFGRSSTRAPSRTVSGRAGP